MPHCHAIGMHSAKPRSGGDVPLSHSSLDREKAGIQINLYSFKCKGDIALLPLRRPLRRCGASPLLQTAAVRTEPARQAFLADAADTELRALVAAAGGLRGRRFHLRRRRSHPSRKDAALWDREIFASSWHLLLTAPSSVLPLPPLPGELRNQGRSPAPKHTSSRCAPPNNRAFPLLLDFTGI